MSGFRRNADGGAAVLLLRSQRLRCASGVRTAAQARSPASQAAGVASGAATKAPLPTRGSCVIISGSENRLYLRTCAAAEALGGAVRGGGARAAQEGRALRGGVQVRVERGVGVEW